MRRIAIRTALAVFLMAGLAAGLTGCQTRGSKEQLAGAPESTSTHKPAAAAQKGPAKATAAPSAKPEAQPQAVRANHVILTDRTCIHFEPHWALIHVGQTITWTSQLKRSVTIHVTAGAFDKDVYVVPAGGSVTTGPAHGDGPYTTWAEPSACREIPRGGQGPGPGVIVEAH